MTPARGLSFFCDFPALPTCPISRPTSPPLPAVSIPRFPAPRPFSPTNPQHPPRLGTFLPSHFPTQKARRHPRLRASFFLSLYPAAPSAPPSRFSPHLPRLPPGQRLSRSLQTPSILPARPLSSRPISPHKKPGGIPAYGPTFPTFVPLWGLHFPAAGPPLTA